VDTIPKFMKNNFRSDKRIMNGAISERMKYILLYICMFTTSGMSSHAVHEIGKDMKEAKMCRLPAEVPPCSAAVRWQSASK
jgi:hypothetical protein